MKTTVALIALLALTTLVLADHVEYTFEGTSTLPSPFSFAGIVASNGVGNLFDNDFVYGFASEEMPYNSSGAVSTNWYVDVVESGTPYPAALEPNPYNVGSGNGRKVSRGRWMLLARHLTDISYHEAIYQFTRNGELDLFQGNYYDIRRTTGPNKGYIQYSDLEDFNETVIDIPFAVWYLGPDPLDTSDDVRMIVGIYDTNGNNEFDFYNGTEYGSVSDLMYFLLPEGDAVGMAAYNAWLLDPESIYDMDEHFVRVSLLNWHNYEGSEGGYPWGGSPTASPEVGTVIRIFGGFFAPRCRFLTGSYLVNPDFFGDNIELIFDVTAATGIQQVDVVLETVPYRADFEFPKGSNGGHLNVFYKFNSYTYAAQVNDFTTLIRVTSDDGSVECNIGAPASDHAFHTVGEFGLNTNHHGEVNDEIVFPDEGGVFPLSKLYSNPGAQRTIYYGSLWVGVEGSEDQAFGGFYDDSKWSPINNVQFEVNFGDEDSYVSFQDLNDDATRNVGVDVTARTSTFNNGAYALIHYQVSNANSSPLNNLIAGLFVDTDIGLGGDYFYDTRGWDSANGILYAYSSVYDNPTAQRFLGIKVISGDPTNSATWTNNEDPSDAADVLALLESPLGTLGKAVGDQRILLSYKFASIPGLSSGDVIFGVSVGHDLGELRSNFNRLVDQFDSIAESEICMDGISACYATPFPCQCLENLMQCTEDAGRPCPRYVYQDQLEELCAHGHCNEGCCENLLNACDGSTRTTCTDIAFVPTPAFNNNTNTTSASAVLIPSLMALFAAALYF